MIRILQVVGVLNIGGLESFIMNVYRQIDRSKIQFDFVKHTNDSNFFDEEIKALGGRIYSCPKYKVVNGISYKKWWNSFLEKHPEYHIVHGHCDSTASIYLRIAKSHGLITIAHSHSTSSGGGLKGLIKDNMHKKIVSSSDYLFACSELAGQWLFGKETKLLPNYSIVRNGIDASRFVFSQSKYDAGRKELMIEKDAFVVGHIGRFCDVKNHQYLVDVFCEILKKRPNSKLVLVGEGPLYQNILSIVKLRKIEKHVLFAGIKKDTEKYYSVMDAFVFPSKYEGLPVSLIEAQTAGIRCYISDIISREVDFNNGRVVYLSINEAAEKWANVICSNENNRIVADELCIKSGYDIRQVADFLQNFYEENFFYEKNSSI